MQGPDRRRSTLRMFGDTLRAHAEANDTSEDTFDVLDREVDWHRLAQAMTEPGATSEYRSVAGLTLTSRTPWCF